MRAPPPPMGAAAHSSPVEVHPTPNSPIGATPTIGGACLASRPGTLGGADPERAVVVACSVVTKVTSLGLILSLVSGTGGGVGGEAPETRLHAWRSST